MATRAAIIMEVEGKDHSYEGVYLHYDGYPEHAGQILTEHYNTLAKVEELISHGGISVLGEVIGEKIDCSIPVPDNQCTFYHRDRGEEINIKKMEWLHEIDQFTDNSSAEFTYLFTDGEWLIHIPATYIKLINHV